MAITLRNNRQRGALGLDIDDGYAAATLVESGRVTRLASIDLPAGLVQDGEVGDVDGLSRVLKDFFKAERLPQNVRLGVGNQLTSVRRLDLPRIENRNELAAAVRFQAADAIAMPLDEAVLDFQVTDEVANPDGGARMHVTVAAARTSMVTKLADAVEKAGLKPEGIDLDAFAIVRMYGDVGAEGHVAAGDDEATDAIGLPARVYCHLAGVTSLAIAIGQTCLFTRSLAASWSGDADDLAATLADEIRLSTDYYMAQPGAQPPYELILSGPGSARAGLADALGERTGMPAVVADPLGALDRAPDLPSAGVERHTVAAGLAIGAQA
jgi:type IV pilus assembly protein PilM